MTMELTPTAEDQGADFLGGNCISVGDVVCLKSGGFAMTVECIITDNGEDEFAEGFAMCAWAKEDETIARDQFRTEMLDNVPAEDEMDDDELTDAEIDRIMRPMGKPHLN